MTEKKRKKAASRARARSKTAGKHHSQKKIEEALTLWVECGSITSTSRETGVPITTLSKWTRDPKRKEQINTIRTAYANAFEGLMKANAGRFAKGMMIGINKAIDALEGTTLEEREIPKFMNAISNGLATVDRIVMRNRLLGDLDAGPMSDLSDAQLRAAIGDALGDSEMMLSFEVTKKIVLESLGEPQRPEEWK